MLPTNPNRSVALVALSLAAGLLGLPPTLWAQTKPTQSKPALSRPTSRPEAPPLRLGTWNLEHFGSKKPARSEADVAMIAAFIRKMKVDVLAVQEINGRAPLHNLMRHLGDDYRFCLGTTGGFDKTFISVGFLWNRRRVDLLSCGELADFPRKIGDLHVFHRKPVTACFRVTRDDQTVLDFRAITVHLKASRGKKNEAKRHAEVTRLREYVEKLRAAQGEDQDIVVLGDFNHTYDAPAHRRFKQSDLVRYLDAEQGPTIVHFDDPIDHVAVTKGIRDEVRARSFVVHHGEVDYSLKSEEELTARKKAWRAIYSDHFPVTIDLSTTRDGDPNATFTAPKHRLPVRDKTARKTDPTPKDAKNAKNR